MPTSRATPTVLWVTAPLLAVARHASVTARPIGCNAATASIAVHSELTPHGVDLHDRGSLTETYGIAVGDMATMTFECGELREPATVTYPAYVGSCPSRLDDLGARGYDLGLIKGAGSCPPPTAVGSAHTGLSE